jgi:hypothetical protein
MVGLNPDNYPIFFRLVESGNRWVIDTLVAGKDAAKFMGTIQSPIIHAQGMFRMLSQWKPGEV